MLGGNYFFSIRLGLLISPASNWHSFGRTHSIMRVFLGLVCCVWLLMRNTDKPVSVKREYNKISESPACVLMPNQMSQFWMRSRLGFSSSSSLQTLSQFDSTRGRITGLTYKMDALYVSALLKIHLMDVWIGAHYFFSPAISPTLRIRNILLKMCETCQPASLCRDKNRLKEIPSVVS